MDIVVLANFCGDFANDAQKNRFVYLSNMFAKKNNVELITSDFNHGRKTHFSLIENDFPFRITMLNEFGYKKNISFRRFFSHMIWGMRVKKYLNERKHPDVIYAAVPSLLAAYFASTYAKKNKVRFILDIQDVWPEAFKMFFNIPLISNFCFFPLKYLSNRIYENANTICAVSKTFIEIAKENVITDIDFCDVYLGTDLLNFDSEVKKHKDSILKECLIDSKKSNDIWLGYCGSLTSSYDIICVLNALELIGNDSEYSHRIKFIIVGDGPKKSEFERFAEAKKVDAVFTGRLEYGKMAALLSFCDIMINPIVKNSAASIINKHADYVASGKPILNTQDSEEFCSLIVDYNMGINVKTSDSIDLASKMRYLIDNPSIRSEMGRNARRCAEELFDRSHTYPELLKIVERNV